MPASWANPATMESQKARGANNQTKSFPILTVSQQCNDSSAPHLLLHKTARFLQFHYIFYMWADSLPAGLKAKISALVQAQPSSELILQELYTHMLHQNKRRKVSPSDSGSEPSAAPPTPNAPPAPAPVEQAAPTEKALLPPISPNETIFELSSLLFTSPVRRKMNLVFHLTIAPDNTPHPLFSVVNMATGIPELSVADLRTSIRLCCLIPILGNLTVPAKKNTAMLCFWLHLMNDPIICTFNLDLVKRQLAKDGKIPPDADLQVAHLEQGADSIKPINELIIDFLERQFSLCGISLYNFMPSAKPHKNQLSMNSDAAIAVSLHGDSVTNFLAVEAYKGSKEGALLLLNPTPTTAFLVFGFKKPITILDFSTIVDVAYKDISKFTFTVVVTYRDKEKEATLELSMIDQKSHEAIDEFVRRMNIVDNSFDTKFRETKPKDAAQDPATGTEALLAEDDDEEEDGSYTAEAEAESDSDLAEEFDSNVEEEDSDLDKDPEPEEDAVKEEKGAEQDATEVKSENGVKLEE